MLENEEKKLIGSFSLMRKDKLEESFWYALNEIYCDSWEVSLLNALVQKGMVKYGDTDFYWHLTDNGLNEWKAYNAELPYPDKGHG